MIMFIENMRERYIFARWCYCVGETYLSDIEYDKLEKEFKGLYPDDEYSKRSWSFDPCPKELLIKYGRQDLIKNLSLGYYAESIYSINNYQEYDSVFSNLNEPTRVSYKIDGFNTRVSYYNGEIVEYKTRGRSGDARMVNELMGIHPQKIPIMGKVAITGELSIPNKLWSSYKSITGNIDQRASISTMIARGDIDYASFLAFNITIDNVEEKEAWLSESDQYALLKKLGFTTPKFAIVNNKEELDNALKSFGSKNKFYGYLTDGLVVENSTVQYAIRLGEWEEEVLNSFVVGYEDKPGMQGCSMVLKVHPTKDGDKTYSNISITNIANIVENNLQVGYPVAFNIRSAANVVIDVTATANLQREWAGKYDKFKEKVLAR